MPCLSKAIMDGIVASTANFNSRRMKILEAIKGILNQITIINGFSYDIDEASFDVNAWRDRLEGDTPAIFVVDDSTPSITRMAGKQRQYKWKVLLFGVVKGMDIYQFEDHLADVQECVELNGYLGGLVSKIEINNIITDNQLFSEKEDTHLYEIELQVEYIQCHGNPR